MIIAEAILTIALAFSALIGTGLLTYYGIEEHLPRIAALGLFGILFSVLALVFQAAALGGHMIITEAVFTFMLGTVGVVGGAVLAFNNKDKLDLRVGASLLLVSTIAIVLQGVVLAG